MQLTWHGLACFRMQADGATLMADPLPNGGWRGPRLAANLIALTDRASAATVGAPGGEPPPLVVSGPGEYEAAGILVEGAALPRGGLHVGYRVIVGGITVVTLGMLPTPPPSDALAALTGGDVLIIPVGGGPVLTASQAAHLINVLEPRIVIPCAYRLPGLTLKLDPLEKFCREIGVCPTETIPKLKLTRRELPTGEMKVVVLAKT